MKRNQKILDRRWKKSEQSFRKNLNECRKIYRDLGDDVLDLFGSMDITSKDLNRTVPDYMKRKLQKSIREWKNEGIVKDYFEFRVNSLKRYSYQNVIELMILGYYMAAAGKISDLSDQIFETVAQDCYSQGREDLRLAGFDEIDNLDKRLSKKRVNELKIVPVVNKPFDDYLFLICFAAYEEMLKHFLQAVQQETGLNERDLNQLLRKQSNRILNVNDDKFTGTIVDTSRSIGNQAYIMAGGAVNQKVRFIAEIDEKTTEMCRSLDQQIFNTVDQNQFWRYSDAQQSQVFYTRNGLIEGLNMPPINDHFHWCRSTLTYQTELSRNEYDELKKKLNDDDIRNINMYLSFESYKINNKLRKEIDLSRSEKEFVDELSATLNKLPNYNGKIYRDVMITDPEQLREYIKKRTSGEPFTEEQFLSFSTSFGYNKEANIHIVIHESMKGKDLRMFNEKESEVLYNKDNRFVCVNHSEKDGIHWIELEEVNDY